MGERAEKRARAEAILGELAELGLMLARELATQARATEDPAQQAVLATAFQKTSRTVRLTLALDAKLDRVAPRLGPKSRAGFRPMRLSLPPHLRRRRARTASVTCSIG
jgi:hypothetical protein